MAALKATLAAARPRIVYVALDFPKQARVIEMLRPAVAQAWFLGVGISFSFVAGEVRRAPRWMQKCGLEWVHRLFQEPKRLFARYILHGMPFALKLFACAAYSRFRKPATPRA